MAGNVLNIRDIIVEDQLGSYVANKWTEWKNLRQVKERDWEEVRQYVYATDTTKTTNSKLPWTNKTTIPKLCQIRDNLHSNYMASLFPKRKWLVWEGSDEKANVREKREAIINYMNYVISQPQFRTEVSKLIYDYIDYGNVIATAEWNDDTIELETKTQVGYVGPVGHRINPTDLVMNAVADHFRKTPKIVRSVITMGEVKEILERLSTPDNQEQYEELWAYLKGVRGAARDFAGDLQALDSQFSMDGFSSYRAYLESDYCELLTFYGDVYDQTSDTFLRNHIIVVVDRHKIILKEPNPSYFGTAPLFHAGWRPRQDNLWAMGPLDNLVGMQYRLDHVENLKADVFDLLTFPPLKIKGHVEDFEWGPFEKIFVGDDGDVDIVAPAFQILEANMEIGYLTNMMEEMAGSPKEAMGFRTPGEKTKYEVQRLENAASRIFQAKIVQFEEQVIEPLLNAMLEMARRKMDSAQIRVFDDEFKAATFMTITPDDISGNGTIRPVAARHFAEKAEMIQNLGAFFQSPIGQDENVKMHFSGVKLSQMMEELLEIKEFKVVTPYIRLSEQADAQRQAQALEEQVLLEAQTATGLGDDFDEDFEAS